MNTNLLFRIADEIQGEPLLYNQGVWGRGKLSSCHSACCVAGWACLIEEDVIPLHDITLRAAEHLDLSADEASVLFSATWPTDWFEGDDNWSYRKPTAQEAPGILRRIANGEIEL